MQEKQKTYHLMILDKSSSMSSVRDATISGLNEQLDSIRKAAEDFDDQEQIVCFVTFASNVDTTQIWNSSIDDIENFTRETYTPDGMTALYDAIGMGVNKLRDQISEELSQRKANVVVTIFTDGEENSSREFRNASEVRELVNGIQDTGQWTVAFVGCGGEEVFTVAQSMGISRGNTMSYDAGVEGTATAFASMSDARYARTMMYSQSISKGIDTNVVNKAEDFFANIDLDTDIQIPETDGPDSAINIFEKDEK